MYGNTNGYTGTLSLNGQFLGIPIIYWIIGGGLFLYLRKK